VWIQFKLAILVPMKWLSHYWTLLTHLPINSHFYLLLKCAKYVMTLCQLSPWLTFGDWSLLVAMEQFFSLNVVVSAKVCPEPVLVCDCLQNGIWFSQQLQRSWARPVGWWSMVIIQIRYPCVTNPAQPPSPVSSSWEWSCASTWRLHVIPSVIGDRRAAQHAKEIHLVWQEAASPAQEHVLGSFWIHRLLLPRQQRSARWVLPPVIWR